jgi:hypothetical protein
MSCGTTPHADPAIQGHEDIDMATKNRKFLLRDVGYDANRCESQWHGIMARDLLSAVKQVLEMKEEPLFIEPIAQYASVYVVYVRCGISEHTKFGCVEIY